MGNCIKSELIIEPPPYHYNVELTLDKDTCITELHKQISELSLEKDICITELHKQISEITLEKDLCIAELHKQINELTLEKDTCIAELKQYTSLPPLNWELELETILKNVLTPNSAFANIDRFKSGGEIYNCVNDIFSRQISNNIKNINIDEIIISICYYSYVYGAYSYNSSNGSRSPTTILEFKLFLITNKNIYKLQCTEHDNLSNKYDINNRIKTYTYHRYNMKYEFIKCKSINSYLSLASIDRYIKYTRGDKSLYQFRTQCGGSGFGSMNLEHDNNTMTRYLNDLESSLLSLF